MKIIKPRTDLYEKECTCECCNAILLVNEHDLEIDNKTDLVYFNCAECASQNTLEVGNLKFKIKDRLLNKNTCIHISSNLSRCSNQRLEFSNYCEFHKPFKRKG
jgi:thiamine pyrophosphokinase